MMAMVHRKRSATGFCRAIQIRPSAMNAACAELDAAAGIPQEGRKLRRAGWQDLRSSNARSFLAAAHRTCCIQQARSGHRQEQSTSARSKQDQHGAKAE